MSAVRRALVVAKAPRPGRAKTRLAPGVPAELGTGLAEAMLLDTVDACREEADEVGLLCPDESHAADLRALVGPDVAVRVQRGRGLRAALREEMLVGTRAGALAIVSSDIPGLPRGELTRALELLREGADLVLGPALDGGYWLIAMTRFHEAPFTGIPWSTPACAGVTLRRARDAGLRTELVGEWLDLDTAVDLSLAIHAPPGPLGARTGQALARIASSIEVPGPPAGRLIGSEVVVASPGRALLRDRLEEDGATPRDHLYLAVPRAVLTVAVTAGGEVLLVRRYRHPVRDWTLEAPAGPVEDGEPPQAAAARGLAEEVGGRGGTWRHLGTSFSSSAHLSLRSDAFLATGVEVDPARPRDEEEVTVVRMPVGEALDHARSGRIVDGQTALCLLLAASHLE